MNHPTRAACSRPLRNGEQYNLVVTFHSGEQETWGAALERTGCDFDAAFSLYQQARIPRTARVVLSAREMGRLYHAKGVERLVRNSLWKGRSNQDFYDALEWLYGWKPETCLDA